MAKNNLPLKVALGYAAVVVVLVAAIWLVYTNTQSILTINQASQEYIQKREKADSTMTALLKEEQNSLHGLSDVLNEKDPKSYLKQKMTELNNGKDSVVVHQKVAKTHEAQRTTVEITKSKKGFLRRLADAFKKSMPKPERSSRQQSRCNRYHHPCQCSRKRCGYSRAD